MLVGEALRFLRGRTRMSIPHCLAHDRKDTVAVIVVEGLKAGTEMLGVVTHDNSDFRIRARQDIPIGHKVALKDIKPGDTVWKYGQDIGKAVAAIRKGEHVHVHNVKTKRW
jgi:(2R)-sulfolactate sulfo-lyase subunit alpha